MACHIAYSLGNTERVGKKPKRHGEKTKMKLSRARYATSIVLLAVLAFWTADLPPADAQEAAGRGTVRTHLSAERPQAGEDVRITVELSNPAGNPQMLASVRLRAPDGTNWSDRRCPVTCEATTPVGTGTNRTVEFALTVNDPGPKTVDGSTTWTTGAGETAEDPLLLQMDVQAPTDDTSVELHASEARVQVGGNLAAHLSVINNHPSESMEVTMALKPPEGTSVTATHNAESCAGECKATYTAGPGEQRTMTVMLAANDAGEFVLGGSARWQYPGTASGAGSTNKYLVLNIDRPPNGAGATAAATADADPDPREKAPVSRLDLPNSAGRDHGPLHAGRADRWRNRMETGTPPPMAGNARPYPIPR